MNILMKADIDSLLEKAIKEIENPTCEELLEFKEKYEVITTKSPSCQEYEDRVCFYFEITDQEFYVQVIVGLDGEIISAHDCGDYDIVFTICGPINLDVEKVTKELGFKPNDVGNNDNTTFLHFNLGDFKSVNFQAALDDFISFMGEHKDSFSSLLKDCDELSATISICCSNHGSDLFWIEAEQIQALGKLGYPINFVIN